MLPLLCDICGDFSRKRGRVNAAHTLQNLASALPLL